LVAIELNDEFVEHLGANYRDSRLHVCRGSALEVDVFLRQLAEAEADAIVSGIPFSTFPIELSERILSKSYQALGPAGRLLVYQFSRAVQPLLRESFPRASTAARSSPDRRRRETARRALSMQRYAKRSILPPLLPRSEAPCT
jgi:phospholipid N-methyltransferase